MPTNSKRNESRRSAPRTAHGLYRHHSPYAKNAADQYFLNVAIKNEHDGEPLAINFFDFSQEPDHEWVELVNVSASTNPINLSNWILEVGNGANDLSTRRFEIPEGTSIAPNGSLLLVADKYDDDFGMVPNGIAATSDAANGLSEASIPRYLAPGDPYNGPLGATFDINRDSLGTIELATPIAPTWTGRWGVPLGSDIVPAAQSDFQRPENTTDFVDRDGDGVAELNTTDDILTSTYYDESVFEPDKRWDRIVQLRRPGNTIPITSPSEVGELVLSGGIFPNYPEGDLIDNDGDSVELMADGIDNDGDRYIFDHDGIDNDNDGLVEEGANGLDDNGNGLIDEAAESEGTDENVNPLLDYDGINNDPGRFPPPFDTVDSGRDGVDNDQDGITDEYDESDGYGIPEGMDEGGIPRFLQFNPVLGPAFPHVPMGPLNPVPGSFSRFANEMLYPTEPAWVEGLDELGQPTLPEWKDFTERRMFPGDCVRVTLYAGLPEEPFVVDRVTYTQNDVENRAPDDVLSAETVQVGVTLADAFKDRFRMADLSPFSSGGGHPRAWPENTMGVDFYRSLERKHRSIPATASARPTDGPRPT